MLITLGGGLLVAKQLALAILQPQRGKLTAGEWEGAVAMADKERQGWQQGLMPSGSSYPHFPFQFSGSRMRWRRRAGLSLCVSSAPFLFLSLALPGPAPSCGMPMPSAAHAVTGQPCNTGGSVVGLSLQQRAEHCSPSQLSQVWGREHVCEVQGLSIFY